MSKVDKIAANTSFLVILLLILSQPALAEEPNYDSYEAHTNEFCHYIHPGDKYQFLVMDYDILQYRDGNMLLKNNRTYFEEYEVMEVPTQHLSLGIWSDARSVLRKFENKSALDMGSFSRNYTHYDDLVTGWDMFVFTDWTAWDNMFANRTIDPLYPSTSYAVSYQEYYYHLDVTYQNRGITFLTTLHYNLSNGILLTKVSFISHTYGSHKDRNNTGIDLNIETRELIKMEQVSNQPICFSKSEPMSETTESNYRGFAFVVLIALIPVVRSRRIN